MTNISGAVVWSATYDAFGKATVDVASTITNNLRFPGQYYDQETGWHYNYFRYYEPESGRYVTEDPIGFVSSDDNIYRYVLNNPLSNQDYLGLAKANIWDIIKGIRDALKPGRALYKSPAKDAACQKLQDDINADYQNYLDKCYDDCVWCLWTNKTNPSPCPEEAKKRNCEKYEKTCGSAEHCSKARLACAGEIPDNIWEKIKKDALRCGWETLKERYMIP